MIWIGIAIGVCCGAVMASFLTNAALAWHSRTGEPFKMRGQLYRIVPTGNRH